MKVLFAVSNENISEAIIKKYPKEYREILSYKNVYYFNAILKEIQKDKSYDRIVISEDLEPFINTNHDSIDNFIFEHLDRISDEAHDNEGKETSIILICSERRAPGSAILNKLFSIGVYNAVMGKDRNLQELCSLINRPRTKKEAKQYYRIDQATYDPSSENEVNEVEIQNILTHFKKLGKNTERYADSFNNIAAQYTDEQLKIIIKVLPMKVKAVLEVDSPKYQALMGSKPVQRVIPENKELGIKVNTIGKQTKINGPIVIPSSVKKTPIRTEAEAQVQRTPKVEEKTVVKVQREVTNTVPVEEPVPAQKQTFVKQQTTTTKTSVIQPTPMKQTGPQVRIPEVKKAAPVVDEEPQITNGTRINQSPLVKKQATVQQNSQIDEKEDIDFEEDDLLESLMDTMGTTESAEEAKRGRGRPKKLVEEPQKPKGKRGRPRKIDSEIEETSLEDSANLDDLLDFSEETTNDNFDDLSDDLFASVETDDGIELPSLDDEEISPEPEEDEVDVSSLLSGLDEEETTIPGLDDSDEESVTIPGLDELDDDSVTIPGLDDLDDISMSDDESFESVSVPGADKLEDVSVPGLNELDDLDDITIPGLDDSVELPTEEEPPAPKRRPVQEEETILPGMGFEDVTEEDVEVPTTSNIIDAIKPKYNYSVSNLNSLLTPDKKIAAFVGTTKNGTSFLVNNLALMFSLQGIDTAVLDMTRNRNSYYIFTDSKEELRNITYTSLSKLENGYAEGIKFNKNLTIYTALPSDEHKYENAEPILSTLVQNHSLVLIDCDFDTSPAYFASSQEIYLVQSMDILTIQPLTAFLRELKFKGAWEPEKARVVINKELNIGRLNGKMIIAGMSRYNGPDMSVMTDLFNKDMVKACSIPFDEKVYSKYLETMATCKLSLSGYSKTFRQRMEILSEMVYPRLNSRKSFGGQMESAPEQVNNNVFSNNMNSTLNQMKNKF